MRFSSLGDKWEKKRKETGEIEEYRKNERTIELRLKVEKARTEIQGDDQVQRVRREKERGEQAWKGGW